MKRSIFYRFSITFVIVFALLSPTAVFAGGDKGKKRFGEGMKFEAAEAWDRAAEEFALALTEDPRNPEYRLHLTRSLFNASQMFMKKGTIAAREKDFAGAYTAFRRAYAYDPTNELAKSEMDRMVRLQQDSVDPKSNDKKDDGKARMVQTSYGGPSSAGNSAMPQKLEKMRDIPFPNGIDLQVLIKELAKELDLNVLFDTTSFRAGGPARKVNIELKNVTAAKALDYIFLQENLFFQKVGPRTILIANADQRARFQQLVLRTFYLANAAPKDIVKVVQTAIPAQPGRSQTIVLTDDATNSVTVRDTEENIRLIGKLIASLDKDRAEVVMDVAIYEVNKTDLLQFGNQIGSQDQLTNFGGSSPLGVRFGNNPLKTVAAAATAALVPSSAVTGIVLPAMNISLFSSKNNTKLIASTQIHAFNNEDSSAVIGQRVPVQSASFLGVGNTGVNTGGNGVVSNVINYEQVGLTLKFKPIVFPNQDVQVAMEIESKDVAGALTATPTFTQRTIKGTARVQNNKTLLLASVAQGVESRGNTGLPLVGLIPIIGRLFTAPTRDNRQVDIVIAVTPRVIRAPAILPEDEVERPTGSQMAPTNNSLEAMMVQEDKDEMLAAARRIPNAAEVQLPDRQAENNPGYVKAGDNTAGNSTATPDNTGLTTNSTGVDNTGNSTAGNTTAANTSGNTTAAPADTMAAKSVPADSTVKPIDNSVRTLQLTQTADTSTGKDLSTQLVPVSTNPAAADSSKSTSSDTPAAPTADIVFGKELSEMKAGEKIKVPVMVQGSGAFKSVTLGLKYDNKQLAVRSITYGDVFAPAIANTTATPFFDEGGKMFVIVEAKDGSSINPVGILAYVEIEALVPGKPKLDFERDVLNVLSPEGKNFKLVGQK